MAGAAPAPLVWVLADDRPGNVNQAMGVAESLGWAFRRVDLAYGPLAKLPNALQRASLMGLARASRASVLPPWPDVVIGAGRRTVPTARWIAARRRLRAFTCQLMWPGSADGLDLIAVPMHDDVPAHPAVIRTLGAPHRVTPERLALAREEWRSLLEPLPAPRIAVLLGGDTKRRSFGAAELAHVVAGAEALAKERGGGLALTTSRRTGDTLEAALSDRAWKVPVHLHLHGSGAANPYLGLLAWADAVVVTADSASMCTEACATGRPVFLATAPDGAVDKLDRLHRALISRGHVRPLGGAWFEPPPVPLNPASEVAAAIRLRYLQRGPDSNGRPTP